MTPSCATAIADIAWKRAFDDNNVSALLKVPSSFIAPPIPLPPMPPLEAPAAAAIVVVLAPKSIVVVVVGPVDIKFPPVMMPAIPPFPIATPLLQIQAPVPLPPPLPPPPFPFPPLSAAMVDGVGVVPPLLRVGLTVVV